MENKKEYLQALGWLGEALMLTAGIITGDMSAYVLQMVLIGFIIAYSYGKIKNNKALVILSAFMVVIRLLMFTDAWDLIDIGMWASFVALMI